MSKESEIRDINKRFIKINEERRELNRKIKDYYQPLLSTACKEKDIDTFSKLCADIPYGAPFYNTAMRMEFLYFSEKCE